MADVFLGQLLDLVFLLLRSCLCGALLPCVLRQSGVFINGVTVGHLAWACSASDEADKGHLNLALR